jgi:hypothetical protein
VKLRHLVEEQEAVVGQTYSLGAGVLRPATTLAFLASGCDQEFARVGPTRRGRCGRRAQPVAGQARRAGPGQAGFAPSSAGGSRGAPLPGPLRGARPPAPAQLPAPGGSGVEAAAVLPPSALIQVLRHDLVDHDLVSDGAGGVLLPQAFGRGAGVGRKPREAFGQLVGDGAEQLTPVRAPLVVFERQK